MSPDESSILHARKRQWGAGTEPAETPHLRLPPKRLKLERQQRHKAPSSFWDNLWRKLERHPQHKTPSSFWDNLSRQWLTRRALREFDKRTECRTVPLPPDRSDLEKDISSRLRRFAGNGGPGLDDLRGYPELVPGFSFFRTMNFVQSSFGTQAGGHSIPWYAIALANVVACLLLLPTLLFLFAFPAKFNKKKTSPYDAAFQQHLIDNGCYPPFYRRANARSSMISANWDGIKERLARPFSCLSPSSFPFEAFQEFQNTNSKALTESSVMSKVFPIIIGNSKIPSQQHLPFGNLAALTDGSITKAQPDFYDGSQPADLDKRVREELGDVIVPSTKKGAPCIPNFFTEVKGPDGAGSVVMRQAWYDGALGARGIHELRSRIHPETAFDNNAYTITSTYQSDPGTLAIYTVHPTRSTVPNIPVEYHMTRLCSFTLTDSPEAFRQGAAAIRNARDWAKEQRDELILAANDIHCP